MLRQLAATLIIAHTVHSTNAPVSHVAVGRVTDEAWGEAFRTPNATGSIRVKGYDLGTPFPGVESNDWVFTIQVRDSIPRYDGKFATGIWVQVDAPDNLVQKTEDRAIVPADSSWQVCQGFLEIPRLRSDAETVGASCEGVVPRDCIEAFTGKLARGFGVRSGVTGFQCPSLAPPKECRDALGTEFGAVGIPLATGNRTNVTESGVFDLARTGLDEDIDGHEIRNTTAYDIAIHRVWLVGLAWGYSNTTGRTSADTPTIAASLSCLRVNQFEPGSRRLSAGVLLREPPSSMWLIIGSALLLPFWM